MITTKIAIIVPYFGEWPPWIDYFLISCLKNNEVDWYFFTDCEPRPLGGENVYIFDFNLDDFNHLASEKLELPIAINNPYKICDFRPAFGEIFADYLEKYDFWGYADLDLIFGDFNNFYSEELFTKYDIITGENEFIPGHFCLLRNDEKINSLYKYDDIYKQIFISKQYFGFDEKILNLKFGNARMNLIYHLIKFKFYSLMRKILPDKARKKLLHCLKRERVSDFSSIVGYFKQRNEIKIFYEKYYLSDLGLMKRGEKNWKVVWERGKLFKEPGDKEILYFHFIFNKHHKHFRVDSNFSSEKFYIHSRGITQA